jgi:hypothetical protein
MLHVGTLIAAGDWRSGKQRVESSGDSTFAPPPPPPQLL